MRTCALALTLIAGMLLAGGCRTAARAQRAGDADLPIALERLVGRHWVLGSFGEEAAPADPTVTLAYVEGRLTGRGGCNRYTATVTPGAGSGELTIGPIASTRMMCPEPAHGIESRFLAVLAHATRVGMRGERLVLVTTDVNGRPLSLLFREQARAER